MVDFINGLLFGIVLGSFIVFVIDPEAIGKQLQRIDSARFENENLICYEHDYTLDLEIP